MANYNYERKVARCSGIKDIEEAIRNTKALVQKEMRDYDRGSPQDKISQDMLRDLDKASKSVSDAYQKGILLEGYKR